MELLKSPAKINLFLDVLSKDNDGFHSIKSILTLIDLHDEILIKDSDSLDINFSGEFSDEINQNNIQILFDFLTKKNFIKSDKYSIKITKNIPVGAGLGGGSSNIATILSFLYSKKIIKFNEAINVARELGSDIEFFLDTAPAIIFGKGNVLRRINTFKDSYLLLVYPNFTLSTEKVYKNNTKFDNEKHIALEKEDYDFDEIMQLSSNSLQMAAIGLCPDIKYIIDKLTSMKGSLYSRMTGSGSCCFAVFNEKDLAQEATNTLKSHHPDWWVNLSKII
ncbi:MAG: 4-(cytidine 5'-diphospho)-2-C-methyl-D-erythritol kinase [Pelagibacterales bacterium]|nr:4-(cytidine 5'-diphospho)-2-C-methyl-D-erythritol kinase [Pelagibacterales bacterium]